MHKHAHRVAQDSYHDLGRAHTARKKPSSWELTTLRGNQRAADTELPPLPAVTGPPRPGSGLPVRCSAGEPRQAAPSPSPWGAATGPAFRPRGLCGQEAVHGNCLQPLESCSRQNTSLSPLAGGSRASGCPHTLVCCEPINASACVRHDVRARQAVGALVPRHRRAAHLARVPLTDPRAVAQPSIQFKGRQETESVKL